VNLSIRRSLSVLAMTLLLTGTLAACGTESQNVEPTVTRVDVAGAPPTRTPTVPGGETPPPSGGAASPAPGGGGEQAGGAPTTVEVDMVDLAFQPTEITIPANTDVTIKAVNKGALPHTFTIPDVADTGEVPGGSSAEVKVNLPAGDYTFDCSVPGHKEAGMVGTVKVVEGGGQAAAQASPPPSGAASSPAAGAPSEGAAAGLPTTLEVDMVDLAFQPTELTIPANTDVTIKAVNKGALPHTFTIPDVEDTGEIASGSSAEVKVNLPAGDYTFDCAVPGHKEAGMVGTLKVVEGGGAAAAPPEQAASAEASPAQTTPAVAGTPEAGGGAALPTTLEIDMVDLAFQPTDLTIPANTDVTIKAVNKGALPHTFTITDVADTGEVASGSSAEVKVNLPPGEYTFDCTVPGHKEAGMIGKLTVVAGSESAGGATTPQAGGTTAEATPAAASPAAGGAAALPTTLEVDMVDLAFEPKDLTIPANTDVTINAVNKGALPHTFTITGVADTGEVAAGASAEVKVNLPAGTYEFDCTVPGHKEAGMVGTLTVVESGGAVAPAASPAASPQASPIATEVNLDMVELRFIPDTLEIPANVDVKVNLSNSGNLPHNFSIKDKDVSVDLAAGDKTSFTLNLPPGTYDFFCNVPGHESAGMVGKLTVVEGGGATPVATPAGQSSEAGATSVEVDMVDLAFQPTEITIAANTDVTIKAVNKGALPHTFTIPDVADTGEVAGGSSAEVKVNLPPGEYTFDCTVPGHKEAGMVGKLIVK
jgi:uncharacterized cupredoxin-like copper-binding protein